MNYDELVSACEKATLLRLRKLGDCLPARLSACARAVAASGKGWEWQHYWAEGAQRWLLQRELTRRLGGTWGVSHDRVFDGWSNSENAQDLMRSLGAGNSIPSASRHCLRLLEKQLVGIKKRHFGKGTISVGYRPQFELGDFNTRSISSRITTAKDRSFEFLSWDLAQVSGQLRRMAIALSLVKTHSPGSYEAFVAFTRRVVPIKQKELVSYSLQELPGHSFINLYHRDRVDLLDDLLHENGHHHLNHHLILGKPLREDPDQIYYSPWRRTLRPIRGIYHAHFTFFWALKLFHDLTARLLSGELDWDTPLTEGERRKILLRYLEEEAMLDFTSNDLETARQRGQITPEGWNIIRAIEFERARLGGPRKKAEEGLSKSQSRTLRELRRELSRQATLTRYR